MAISTTASITSSETFAARAQRSEEYRVSIWTAVLAGLVVLAVVRRRLHGVVMSSDLLFWLTMGVLGVSIGYQLALWAALRRANRAGRLLPAVVWRASAFFDLCVPMALLGLLEWFSPRGAIPALSAPALLLLPLVVLLSILRLRPRLTLGMGLAAAVFHAGLVLRAIQAADLSREQYPVYFTYGVVLALTAVSGMLVAREVKGHVVAAAEEAAGRERSERSLELMQRDLAIARDIQQGLLPARAPQFEGFEIAGMSRPADLTGGDYYDWQILPDGRLIAVMADVTGHGIGPALVMAVCRAYARASASMISDPAPLMRRLNELLQADLPAGRFITLVIAILDTDGRVELLSAGHGPSFLYRRSTRQARQYGGDGLPLGISLGERYEPPASFEMDEGDVLVLLTDGFFECRRTGDGEEFGIDRLEQTLVARAQGNPQAILDSLDGAVRAFAAGAVQQDDMTAVVIKRTCRAHEAAGGDSQITAGIAQTSTGEPAKQQDLNPA